MEWSDFGGCGTLISVERAVEPCREGDGEGERELRREGRRERGREGREGEDAKKESGADNQPVTVAPKTLCFQPAVLLVSIMIILKT
eukprot:3580600-Rhodomonas_salina.2